MQLTSNSFENINWTFAIQGNMFWYHLSVKDNLSARHDNRAYKDREYTEEQRVKG